MTEEKAWIALPNKIDFISFDYCMIHHFPNCGAFFRSSLVQLQEGANGPVIRHHCSAEIVHIIDGKVLSFVDNEVRLLIPGTIIFIPPKTTHGFKTRNGNARLFVIHSPAIPAKADHERIAEDFDWRGIIL